MAFLIGDSHTEALRDGFLVIDPRRWPELGTRLQKVGILGGGFRFLNKFFVSEDNYIEFTDEAMSARFAVLTKGPSQIERNDERKFVFSMGGHIIHLLKPELWGSYSLFGGTSAYISQNAFKEMARSFDGHVLAFFDHLQQFNVEFSVCVCPPPSEGEWQRRASIFPDLDEFRSLVTSYRKNFVESLEEMGIGYCLPPEEALDQGLLKCDYLSSKRDDAYHANEEYGCMMLEKLASEGFF